MRRFRSSARWEDSPDLFELMCVLPKLWYYCFIPDYAQVNNNFTLSLLHVTCSQNPFFSPPGFYFSPSSVTGCLPCLCHTGGSVNQICDKLTGQCVCQDASVTGHTCERCKELYFGFDSVTGRWVFLPYRSPVTSSFTLFSHGSWFTVLVTMKRRTPAVLDPFLNSCVHADLHMLCYNTICALMSWWNRTSATDFSRNSMSAV